jgi:lipopolysaccharide transport system permease protein
MLRSWRHQVELVGVLVAKEFRIRYRSSLLGVVWSLLNPVCFALVLYAAFRPVVRVPTDDYVAFLLAGLFPWQWFANTVASAPAVYIGNAALVKRTALPRMLLPVASATNHLLHFIVALCVALPTLMLTGHRPAAIWLVGIPLLLLVQGALCLGLALLLSTLNVLFRDLEHLTLVLLNLLFFMTPTLYSEDLVPAGLRAVFAVNPMAHLVPLWRHLVLDGRLDGSALAGAVACSSSALLLGWLVHRHLEARLAEGV